MHGDSTSFDGGDNPEAGIVADFSHGTDSSARLFEQDIPRPGCGAGAEEDAFSPLHQRFGEAWRVAHHTIDDAVEQQLHLPGDVAPIARCSHDDGIGLLNHLQYALRVVLSHYALSFRPARHTTDAWFDVQVVGANRLQFIASRQGLFAHNLEHLRNQPLFPRASVYDQYVHCRLYLFSVLQSIGPEKFRPNAKSYVLLSASV